MNVRKRAKYFTRTEVKEIARQAFIAGQQQGMKDATNIYWRAKPDQDTEAAFIQWRENQDVETLK